MPKLVRTITYTGPQKWLDMCVDNAFVALKQELSRDGSKSITSKWRDVKAQKRAEKIADSKRKLMMTAMREVVRPPSPLD
jgi:hypothetical protein